MCPGAEPRWSLAELIHAVILMAHAHSLCSFGWGCGLNPEPDHIGGYTFQLPSPNHLPPSPHSPQSPRSPAHEDSRPEVSRAAISYHRSCVGFVTAEDHHILVMCSSLLQLGDGAMEVEVLMQRMVALQQQEEECTQEEMVTRFERERSESIPTSKYMFVPSVVHSV